VSFEDAFFAEHASEHQAALERAERFVGPARGADRGRRATLFNLLEEHGRPGNVIVLGDTALFGLCEALDLPRRLYDETLSGSRGFWILVVPASSTTASRASTRAPPCGTSKARRCLF
jgi:hypothetical protein